MRRRGFFATLLALAALPFATKIEAGLAVEAPAALGNGASIIGETEALDRARAWVKDVARVQLYVPHGIVYAHHPPSDYFFFWMDRGDRSYVGGDETIAVRKSDGRVSYCGWIGE